MIIKWIDKKSVLSDNKKTFKAGDVIPADFLTKSRLAFLIDEGKIEKMEPIGKIDPVKSEKEIEKQPEKVKKSKKKKTKTEKDKPEIKKESFDITGLDGNLNEVNDNESSEE